MLLEERCKHNIKEKNITNIKVNLLNLIGTPSYHLIVALLTVTTVFS